MEKRIHISPLQVRLAKNIRGNTLVCNFRKCYKLCTISLDKICKEMMWLKMLLNHHFSSGLFGTCGPGSSVGIATGYGLDDPGIEFRWRRDFPHLSRPALGPTQPPVNR
jgi:hypothetical protein